jgi:hypothetical protein
LCELDLAHIEIANATNFEVFMDDLPNAMVDIKAQAIAGTHCGCFPLGLGQHDIQEIGCRWHRRDGFETAGRHEDRICMVWCTAGAGAGVAKLETKFYYIPTVNVSVFIISSDRARLGAGKYTITSKTWNKCMSPNYYMHGAPSILTTAIISRMMDR